VDCLVIDRDSFVRLLGPLRALLRRNLAARTLRHLPLLKVSLTPTLVLLTLCAAPLR
jgi:hypothetical protein